MSEIKPFAALRYDPARVALSRVLAPPYDVIAAEDRAGMFDRDPHNAIRLELTRDIAEQQSTDYAVIPRTLEEWIASGVLVRDSAPALYPLRQRFSAPDGASTVRDGFFALLRLEDYGRRIVRPHERTLLGPKADRLKVLRAARANLSPVFLLYEDREQELSPLLAGSLDAERLVEADDAAGISARLARLEDPERVAALCDFFADRPLVIADGHHRYETALTYRNEALGREGGGDGSDPSEWLLVYLANAFAKGSLLLPIHRLILAQGVPSQKAWQQRLPGWSERRIAVESAEAIPDLLAEHLAPLADRHAFAADDASGTLRIFSRPADGELGIRVVHREVIAGVFGLDEAAVEAGGLDYPKSALQTAHDLRGGRGSVALYLNPLPADDVFRVTEAGDVLPQKSTFFFPKLPTGLLFRTFA